MTAVTRLTPMKCLPRVSARQPGVELRLVACDVSDREAVSRLFRDAAGGVRGVVHCAGSLSDGLITSQDAVKLGEAWEGKVLGAINLHLASLAQPRPLDLLLVYGSSSALLGSPGESTYAAANAAADALAVLRRQAGLCGTSLQWGTWTGLGFASPAFNEELARAGFPALTASHGSKVLTALLNQHEALPAVLGCVPIEWATLVSSGPACLTAGCLSSCEAVLDLSVATRLAPQRAAPETDEMRRRYAALEGREERRAMLESSVTDSIAEVSGLVLGRDESVLQAGLSSVQGMQLVHLLDKRLGVRVKVLRDCHAAHSTADRCAAFDLLLMDRACAAADPAGRVPHHRSAGGLPVQPARSEDGHRRPPARQAPATR